jgi:cell shape-determining protein MreC
MAPVPDFAVSVVHTLGTPLWYLRDTIGDITTNTYASLRGTVMLVHENASLRADVLRLERENQYARTLLRENERLRTVIGTGIVHDGRIPATIVHAQAVSPYDTFVVDVGLDDGVREGMLVTTPEYSVVGVIVRSVTDTSIARALTASGMETDALLMGVVTTPLQIVGQGAGTMVGELPRDTPVTEGELVTLPGIAVLPVGTVVSVRADSEDAYQQLFIAPLANPRHVRHVVVRTEDVWRPSEGILCDAVLSGSGTSTGSVEPGEAL